MLYKNIAEGRFISRPNRFIANVEIDGQIQVVHVKKYGKMQGTACSGHKGLL